MKKITDSQELFLRFLGKYIHPEYAFIKSYIL
jgi:hypothetical protein